ncbi:hypothetical protein DID88_001345 [Monilinia fructigena]|uniref:Uncharacterized protein n=1 Tax=Monilinia fructigena TaxID=38457 RepID=A0A395J3J8_9HELO|nr:hypothetical protein DID88_001345 [Monilinia fructigena]
MSGFTIDRSKTIHVPFRGVAGPTNVADRLRKCEKANEERVGGKKIRTVRKSRFREEGLDDEVIVRVDVSSLGGGSAAVGNGLKTTKDTWSGTSTTISPSPVFGKKRGNEEPHDVPRGTKIWNTEKLSIANANTPPIAFSTMPRVALLAFLIAVVIPAFGYPGRHKDNINIMNGNGADAGVIQFSELVDNASMIEGRADSPTSICTRWSHMTANVNGTLYIYGGEATTKSGQITGTWNNDFVKLDLTRTWQIASPVLSGLPKPSGPPAVAMGSLWHTYDSLFLYGGEFSDSPQTSPSAVATWKYDIAAATWTEFSNPQTEAGNSSDVAPADVQRAAEGAGLSVPELGRSWYFGGHLDLYTTPGWSNQVARVYLKSLLEFTHPGYTNDGVASLGTTRGAGAGSGGKGLMVSLYMFRVGEKMGLLLGLAGGTNETFTEMNIIDVYDIANSTWYIQSTSGATPPIRVDPCAVVAAAPDGSSFNVYLYGGQNLIPYGNQIQYSDMWILTIPSFTWIQVDMSDQSQPPARAGHTCNIWDGQIVVVGGYVGKNISCDSPGIYVFNASSLQWSNTFTALSSSSSPSENQDSDIIKGSTGYTVPDSVISVIGGSPLGGATVSTPAAGSATAGPLATVGTSNVMLGPFGTDVSGTNGVQTPSMRSEGGGLSGPGNEASGSGNGSEGGYVDRDEGIGTYVYGGGVMPGGASYQRISEEDEGVEVGRGSESLRAGWRDHSRGKGSVGSISSSLEDLLGNTEPSFFNVMMNPRRTLRVVNND